MQLPEVPPSGMPVYDWKSYAPVIGVVVSVVSLLLNVLLTIVLFWRKNKRDDFENERKIRFDCFKNLVLDKQLDFFFEFFNKVEVEMRKMLTSQHLNPSELSDFKRAIDESIKAHHKDLRLKFLDAFLAVDKNIYRELLNASDKLVDEFTNCLFDEGLKLTHPPKFDEKVMKQLSVSKTAMIRAIFRYSGGKPPDDDLPS